MTIETINGEVKLMASLLNPWDMEALYASIELMKGDGYYIVEKRNSQYTMTCTVILRRPRRHSTWKEITDDFARLCNPEEGEP